MFMKLFRRLFAACVKSNGVNVVFNREKKLEFVEEV